MNKYPIALLVALALTMLGCNPGIAPLRDDPAFSVVQPVKAPLPCAAVWTGQQPRSPTYRFDRDPGVIRLLNSPELYDEVLIDVGRFYGDREYQFHWIADMHPAVRSSLITATVLFHLRGKHVTWYMGGIHNEQGDPAKGIEPDMQDDRWCELYSRCEHRAELERIFASFAFYHPMLSVCFDGMGGGDTEKSRSVRAHVIHDLRSMRFWSCIKVEGYARPGRTISGFPSLITGKELSEHPLPTGYAARDHAIIMQSAHGQDNVGQWLAAGHKVFLGSPSFGPGRSLPVWYALPQDQDLPNEPKPEPPIQ